MCDFLLTRRSLCWAPCHSPLSDLKAKSQTAASCLLMKHCHPSAGFVDSVIYWLEYFDVDVNSGCDFWHLAFFLPCIFLCCKMFKNLKNELHLHSKICKWGHFNTQNKCTESYLCNLCCLQIRFKYNSIQLTHKSHLIQSTVNRARRKKMLCFTTHYSKTCNNVTICSNTC